MLNKILNFFKKQKCSICSHDWNYNGPYRRTCKNCGDYQVMMYHKYGPIRTSWESLNID